MALADHADDDGTNCYPAVPYVAWKTGYSERQVRRVIKKLRDAGALIPIDDARGPGYPIHYQVTMNGLAEKLPYKRPKRYLSAAARVRIIERDGLTCQYCGKPGAWTTGPDGQRWHIDRIIPAAKGGTYADDNVVLACATCNRRKGVKLAPLTTRVNVSAISDPTDAIVEAHPPAIQESSKPSVTIIEPSEEPSLKGTFGFEDGLFRTEWITTLRAIDGWKIKGEPHVATLWPWVIEKGWTEQQLEASAIGLASCSDKTLKGYRDMAAAFQRRLNQGYDDPGRDANNGRRAGSVPATPGSPSRSAGGGWDNRGT